jgi:hypothetical protein
MIKNPVNTLIAARKNRSENPSVIVFSWFSTVGAKWDRLISPNRIIKNTSDSTWKIEANVEVEDEAVPYTLLYRCPAPNSISEIKRMYGSSVSITRWDSHTTSSNCSRGVKKSI